LGTRFFLLPDPCFLYLSPSLVYPYSFSILNNSRCFRFVETPTIHEDFPAFFFPTGDLRVAVLSFLHVAETSVPLGLLTSSFPRVFTADHFPSPTTIPFSPLSICAFSVIRFRFSFIEDLRSLLPLFLSFHHFSYPSFFPFFPVVTPPGPLNPQTKQSHPFSWSEASCYALVTFFPFLFRRSVFHFVCYVYQVPPSKKRSHTFSLF